MRRKLNQAARHWQKRGLAAAFSRCQQMASEATEMRRKLNQAGRHWLKASLAAAFSRWQVASSIPSSIPSNIPSNIPSSDLVFGAGSYGAAVVAAPPCVEGGASVAKPSDRWRTRLLGRSLV